MKQQLRNEGGENTRAGDGNEDMAMNDERMKRTREGENNVNWRWENEMNDERMKRTMRTWQ